MIVQYDVFFKEKDASGLLSKLGYKPLKVK